MNSHMQLNRKWRFTFLLCAFLVSSIIVAQVFYQSRAILAGFFQGEQSLMVSAPPVVLAYPKIASVTPQNDTLDVVLDIEDPIIVRFKRSVKEFNIDFRFEPTVAVVYENNSEKTEFRLLPTKPLGAGERYALKIYAKRQGESNAIYRNLGETTFTTLAKQPEKWSADFGQRLKEASRYARPLMREGKYIDVNLENQTLATFEDGKLLDVYLISSGRRGMETPRGTFKIHNKAARPWSKTYGLYMPYWMAITADGKFGIHELPEWPSGYKEGANHLGTPISHGCIRLGIDAAKTVWDWANVGTAVIVH